jgi:protocatechuate 3,4-dioxygenase beta subunit
MALSVSPSWAVPWLTVNGQIGGTLTAPAALVMRADTSAAGNMLQFVIGIDANENGVLDAGEELVEALCVRDGAYNDESAIAGVVQFTFSDVPPRLWGRFVVAALDEDGLTAEHGYQIVGPSSSQTISGIVRDSAGSPVAGAMVGAYFMDREGLLRNPDYMAFTGASGAFSMAVAPGQYEVMASPVNADVASVPALYRVRLAAGQSRTDLKFTLDPAQGAPYTIQGYLTAPGAEPVVDYQVTATLGGDSRDAYTDIEGHYVLKVSAGTWTVFPRAVRRSGYYYYSGSSQMVTVPPSKTGVNFSMSIASNVCTGRVTDQNAAPVPAARGRAWNAPTQEEVEAACNNQGKYMLYLPNGTYQINPSRVEGYAFDVSGTASRTLPPNATADFTVHSNNIAVSGRVTRTDTGAGVAYAYIIGSPVSPQWRGPDYSFEFKSHADANGYYTLHVPPGQYNVGAASLLLGSQQSQPVDATTNRTGVNFSLAVQNSAPVLSNGYVTPQSGLAGATFTFRVTYTDAQNNPPMQVYLFLDGWPRLMQPANPADTNYTDGAIFQYSTQVAAGSHTFSFGAIEGSMDWAGYIVALPASGSYTGPTITTAGYPTVSITSPANGATIKGVVAVSATASDPGGIQKVEFYDGATLKATDTSAPYQWSWDTRVATVAEGLHTISAKAFNNAAHTTLVSIQVNVDNCTFDDVPKTNIFWQYIEALVAAGVTSGCQASPLRYCPENSVLREQMAKFICKAAGKTELKPATPTFSDVPKTNVFYGWIERLVADGVTSGCQASPLLYCPSAYVRRDQMAKFICKAAGKTELKPDTPTFSDVPKDNVFYGWIERLVADGVTSGCQASPLLYCPSAYVRRDQMAKFLVRAFGL